jgi:hypothetical protein
MKLRNAQDALKPRIHSSMPSRHPLKALIEEGLREPLFAGQWCDPHDITFRPYAAAAMRLGKLNERTAEERKAAVFNLTTAKRRDVLAGAYGRPVSAGAVRLLAKTAWLSFTRDDWVLFLDAAADQLRRRALAHAPRITARLVRQIGLIPGILVLPNVVGVMNDLAVSSEQWHRLRLAVENVTVDCWARMTAAAHLIDSIGAFWDFFHDCVEDRWRPWHIPAAVLNSELLEPLTGAKEMVAEGIRMKNCLGTLLARGASGRQLFFRLRGDEMVTASLKRGTHGWTPGSVLGPANETVEETLAERIQQELAHIAALLPAENGSPPECDDLVLGQLVATARAKFSAAEIELLAEPLRDIRGKSVNGQNGAYAIFEAKSRGYVQFMSSPDGTEYLCEIGSHKYLRELEKFQTAQAVKLIGEAGFLWPYGQANFIRMFPVKLPSDCERLAEIAMAILDNMFRHRQGHPLKIIVHIPAEKGRLVE